MSVELAVRATVLLAIGAGLSWSLRTWTAAARHALWHLTVITTLALPLVALISPAWALLPMPEATATTGGAMTAPARATGLATAVACGAALVALYFVGGYLRLWTLRRGARPAPLGWSAAADRLSARIGVCAPDILVSASVSGPLVTGLLRPVVLIPPAACAWSDARRDAVLLHELAHVQRRDLLSQLMAQLLVALHWFNPLAWHALREMRRERELACDDEVLRAGVAPICYATELLAIAAASSTTPVPAAALSMARPSELEGRLLGILATRRRGGQRLARLGMALVLGGTAVTVAGAQMVPEREATPAGSVWTGSRLGRLIESAGDGNTLRAAPVGSGAASDSDSRERATLALALSSGEFVVPSLLEALGDPDAGVREKAAVGLAWRRDARIGPALVKAAADPDPGVREKVLVALAFSGHPRAGAVLQAARSDPDAGVRDKATKLAVLR